jgi:hypothetical protein
MRRIVLIALALLAVASLLVQLVLNRPTGGFENQPAGWASSEAGDDLSGSLAAFHIAAMAVQLSANDYARVTAYASQAYMAARYGRPLPRELGLAVTGRVNRVAHRALRQRYLGHRQGLQAGEV